jgi:hypothetical protein
VVAVVNRTHQEEIGVIRWYPSWRQYCFMPHPNTIWNKNCLNDVNDMITELMPVSVKPKSRPKTIGVIAYSVDDFIDWRIEKKHKPSRKAGVRDTNRDYVYRNTRYYCVSRATHCCSMSFDKIIETNRAHQNKDYDNIITCIRPTLKKSKST